MAQVINVEFDREPKTEKTIYIICKVVKTADGYKILRRLHLPEINWSGKMWHDLPEDRMVHMAQVILDGIR